MADQNVTDFPVVTPDAGTDHVLVTKGPSTPIHGRVPLPAGGSAYDDTALQGQIDAHEADSVAHAGAFDASSLVANIQAIADAQVAHQVDTGVHLEPAEVALLHDGAAQDTAIANHVADLVAHHGAVTLTTNAGAGPTLVGQILNLPPATIAPENLILGGAAPTAGDGADGDYWIDTSQPLWPVYGAKAAGAWPASTGTVFDQPAVLLDEDDFVSDSDTQAPTQQSVKAYSDTKQPIDLHYVDSATAIGKPVLPNQVITYGEGTNGVKQEWRNHSSSSQSFSTVDFANFTPLNPDAVGTTHLNFRYVAESVDSGAAAEQGATWIDGVTWPPGKPNDLFLWNENIGAFNKGDVYRCIRSTIGVAPDWEKWISEEFSDTILIPNFISSGFADWRFTIPNHAPIKQITLVTKDDRAGTGLNPGDPRRETRVITDVHGFVSGESVIPGFTPTVNGQWIQNTVVGWNLGGAGGFYDIKLFTVQGPSGLRCSFQGNAQGQAANAFVAFEIDVEYEPTYQLPTTAPVPVGYEVAKYTGTLAAGPNTTINITIPTGKVIVDYKVLVNFSGNSWLNPAYYSYNTSYGAQVYSIEAPPAVGLNSMGTILQGKHYRCLVTFAN